MCIICTEWEKGKLSAKEAMRAIGEMVSGADQEGTDHLVELSDRIMDKEVSSGTSSDTELDAEWERRHRGSD